MKKILLSSLIAAAAAVPAFAGVNNINYQAVIKNGDEVVAGQSVEMKFEFLDKSDKVVYSEELKPTTNSAGYVSCQLGGDEDALSTIEWGDLTLRVSVNLGSGYQVVSNETVSSVPTALYALRSADTEAIMGDLEKMMVDVESNKVSILGVNAELARVDGFIEEQDAFNNDIVEKVGPMMGLNYEEVEDQFDRLHKEIISLQEADTAAENNFENLGENLTNFGTEMDAKFAEVNAQLENLNQVAAVVRVNEENIEGLQKDFENLGENLTMFGQEMEANFTEVNGQLENLNMVASVVRENEEAIATITTELQKTQKESEETAANVRSLTADVAQIEGLAETSEKLVEAVQALENADKETKDTLRSMSADVAQIEGLAQQVEDLKEQIQELQEMMQGILSQMGYGVGGGPEE